MKFRHIDADKVRDLLNYCPETGVFTWKDSGKVATHLKKDNGHNIVIIDNKTYPAGRLAWLYVYGSIPDNEIKRFNDISSDDRIANLYIKPHKNEQYPELTQDRLKSVLDYDPETGRFDRKHRAAGVRPRDAGAGWLRDGYTIISIDGAHYRAHRLAWLYVHGRWPVGDVDHVNRDRSDNRLVNLREATRSNNCVNSTNRMAGKSGFRNVRFNKQIQKWYASLRYCHKSYYLGSFGTPEEAHEAYLKKARELHGEFFAE